jgi:hypothetical protein
MRRIWGAFGDATMRVVQVFLGNGGWWARIDKPGSFMERGPYRFWWVAKLAFPIQRWTW